MIAGVGKRVVAASAVPLESETTPECADRPASINFIHPITLAEDELSGGCSVLECHLDANVQRKDNGSGKKLPPSSGRSDQLASFSRLGAASVQIAKTILERKKPSVSPLRKTSSSKQRKTPDFAGILDATDFSRPMSKAEQMFLEGQIKSFRKRLTQEERESFDDCRRLPKHVLRAWLATLSEADLSSRGIRFAKEMLTPPPFQKDHLRGEHLRIKIRVKAVLMDLWDFADLLWLELFADMHTRGINMGFSGDPDLIPRRRNAVLTPTQTEDLRKTSLEDKALGRLVGFFEKPPFAMAGSIGIVAVPKKDGSTRICKHYSTDINPFSDKIENHPQPFLKAVKALHEAGPEAWLLIYDVEGAFQTMKLSSEAWPLTQFFVPDLGWAYRLTADFGASVYAYRWEFFGGGAMATAYRVLSRRAHYNKEMDTVLFTELKYDRPLYEDLLTQWEKYTSLGASWKHPSRIFLSSMGQKILSDFPITAPLLLDPTIVVDDAFLPVLPGQAKIACKMIGAIHRRFNVPLKHSKTILDCVNKFYGFLFEARSQVVSVPPVKVEKAMDLLKDILESPRVSVEMIESLAGLLCWMRNVFPRLSVLLRSGYAFLTTSKAVVAKTKNLKTTSNAFIKPKEYEADSRMVMQWLKAGIGSSSIFLLAAHAELHAYEVVVHMNWCGKTNIMAGFCLTSGEWFAFDPPSALVEAAVGPKGKPSSPILEAVCYILCMTTFSLRGRMVLMCSDSLTFVEAFHNMSATIPLLAAICKLCALTELQAACRAVLCHITGVLNLSDLISRNQMEDFRCQTGRLGFSSRPSPLKSRLPPAPNCLSGFL